jgi:MoxR-like ATPase
MSVFESVKRQLDHLNEQIIGQSYLTERLFIALLADGHLLVEGAPGLAKTTAIKALSEGVEGDFHRVQFTPDLLPADLTGTEIYRPQDGSFHFQQGPLFHNLLLADEINRAPAKVQSALLEAMGERQITVGRTTYPLPNLFLVMATQNPIEQEGTYPLPEAQLDRFLMHINIDFPDLTSEKAILKLVRKQQMDQVENVTTDKPEVLSQQQIFQARKEVCQIHMAENVEEYLLQLIMATRKPQPWGDDLVRWIRYGASPRATISLDRCARAHAWMNGRDFVSPDDVQAIAPDVLRHRLLVSFEAEAEGMDSNGVVSELISRIPVP